MPSEKLEVGRKNEDEAKRADALMSVTLPSISEFPFLESWVPDLTLCCLGISNSHAGGNQMSSIARSVVA
jgi:hypothetical protein